MGRSDRNHRNNEVSFGRRPESSGLAGIRYELLSVVHTEDSESLLTDRQRECLMVAHQRGYFEVPRQCNLTELGDALGVDKSTASETIRRATDRVVAQYFLSSWIVRPRYTAQ
ncbi:helix-turn-helix domain-containing protein [Haloplanus salinarum]|uniref:helix-turn-helix domain-containing protein n=1 Tax=Haloplanus salinarum TaxID=1912324 RepID=UPI003B428A92